MSVLVIDWGDHGFWDTSSDYGREISDELWAEYKAACARILELEEAIEAAPWVDHRPPPTPEQIEFAQRVRPIPTPLRNKLPRS